jgi:hypothetical protein
MVWTGVGVLGLLVFSPIPAWIVLGGMAYGFYRLFKYLKRAYDQSFIIRKGVLPNETFSPSMLSQLFGQGPLDTEQLSVKVQDIAMQRIISATGHEEEGLRGIFQVPIAESGSEGFYLTAPTEVSVSNSTFQTGSPMERYVNENFNIRVRFFVGTTAGPSNKRAEVIAEANIVEDKIQLTEVEVRELRGTRKVKLKGQPPKASGEPIDTSGVSKGEGEGQTIDATKWSSK